MVNGKLRDTRIVFMGTPEFAVGTLSALVENGYNVAAVITAPDKPAGRGMQLQASAVKQYAESQSIKVLQPTKLRDEAFLEELKKLNADLFIVVAFRMLPEVVWRMPRLGTFNLHASLLPSYRGAAPINWAIINGETETGVTTFFLNEEIDAGKILLQEKVEILPADNAETLHDKLMAVGRRLVLKTVDGIVDSSITPAVQESGKISEAPKLFKENTRIDWQKPAHELVNFVRGLSPYPAAWCELLVDEKPTMVKIFAAHAHELVNFVRELSPYPAAWCELLVDEKPTMVKIFAAHAEASPADQTAIFNDGKSLKLPCGGGSCLCIDELQLTGKKRMKAEDFLRGFRGEISLQ